MTSTRVFDERAIIPRRAAGYVLDRGELANEDWTAPTWNALVDGNLYVSVGDLARWNAALLHGSLVTPATRERMWTVFRLEKNTPNAGEYGLGFFVRSVNGHRLIEHEGHLQGFSSYIGSYPNDSIGVAVLTNLG